MYGGSSDKYIQHIESNIFDESEDYLDRLPRNEVVLQKDLAEFSNSINDILTEVYGKDSSEYSQWITINENHFEIDKKRAYKNAEIREERAGRLSSNFLLSELSKIQRGLINETVRLLSNLQVKYQLKQDNKEEKSNVQIKIDKAIGSSIIGSGTVQGSIIGTQYNYASEQKQTLAEAAGEIQKLLKQLKQTDPTATEFQQIEHLNDETTPKFKRKVVTALEAVGNTAIDEFLDSSYIKVGKAAIMGWMEVEK